MPPDLDTLLIALYVFVDGRSGPGRKPWISDAELAGLLDRRAPARVSFPLPPNVIPFRRPYSRRR